MHTLIAFGTSIAWVYSTLIGRSVPRGPVRDRYGGWDPFIM